MKINGSPEEWESIRDSHGNVIAWIGTRDQDQGAYPSEMCGCGHQRRFHSGDEVECLVAGCDCERFGMAGVIIVDDDWPVQNKE